MLQGVEDLFEFTEIKDDHSKTAFLFVVKGKIDGDLIKKNML